MKNVCLIFTGLLLAGVLSCQPSDPVEDVASQAFHPKEENTPEKKVTLQLAYRQVILPNNSTAVRVTMSYAGSNDAPGYSVFYLNKLEQGSTGSPMIPGI